MKKLNCLVALASFAFGLSVQAAVTHLALEYRALLSNAELFHPVQMSEVPASVVALIADGSGRLAAPGEAWQPTDVLGNLPHKRLVWVGVAKNYYLLHYERGGFVHAFNVALIQLGGDNRPDLLWHAATGLYSDLPDFAKALEANLPDDNPSYAY